MDTPRKIVGPQSVRDFRVRACVKRVVYGAIRSILSGFHWRTLQVFIEVLSDFVQAFKCLREIGREEEAGRWELRSSRSTVAGDFRSRGVCQRVSIRRYPLHTVAVLFR